MQYSCHTVYYAHAIGEEALVAAFAECHVPLSLLPADYGGEVEDITSLPVPGFREYRQKCAAAKQQDTDTN